MHETLCQVSACPSPIIPSAHHVTDQSLLAPFYSLPYVFTYIASGRRLVFRDPRWLTPSKMESISWESVLPSSLPVGVGIARAALATKIGPCQGLEEPLTGCKSRVFRTIPVGRSVLPLLVPCRWIVWIPPFFSVALGVLVVLLEHAALARRDSCLGPCCFQLPLVLGNPATCHGAHLVG
jgi:hypothetical protein